jgi:regulator of sigma D
VNINNFLETMDISKIPKDHREGFLCAKEKLWKVGDAFVKVNELSDEYICDCLVDYMTNGYMAVRDYLLGDTDGKKRPSIWVDIFRDELEARHGKG